VATLCHLLDVSRSGYYAWRTRPPSARARANQELTRHIRAAHEQSRGTYGAPRIWAELRDRGLERIAENLRV
jgi:putative transposase